MATHVAPIEPGLDLFSAIADLKRSRNAILLAHYYQDPDIQDIADCLGDSLALAQKAAATDSDVIVFAGVHFMAETAKIVNPSKIVLLPDLAAGCSLADSCPAEGLAALKAQYPGYAVISYINCSAAVKAESDLICTSSNAEKMVDSIPKDQGIIFAPDRNLGRWLIERTGRDMVLWQGSCIVHETFSERKLVALKIRHPSAVVLAHPECEQAVLAHADVIGSTQALLNHVAKNPMGEYIVATEAGILHQMAKVAPAAILIPAPPEGACACNECPYMRLNTLEKVYLCLRDMGPQIELSDDLLAAARVPMDKMLALGK
jgi:quinolinate synthase